MLVRASLLTSLLLCSLVLEASVLRAETYLFHIRGGGQLRGKLVNATESPREKFVIEPLIGGRLTLNPEQVERFVQQSDEQLEYLKIKDDYPDTIEGQWELAEWCRERRLLNERETHLKRILEQDPDHQKSRIALGYFKNDGRWVTQVQLQTERGYVKYKGQWMLPQEVELAERRRKQELAEKAWYRDIKRLRGWLEDQRRADRAKDDLLGIEDPSAVAALQYNLDPENEEYPKVREVYLRALANIGTGGAHQTMLQTSLFDPDTDVRYTAMELLAKTEDYGVVEGYIKYLKNPDNEIINRAALGLRYMNHGSALDPLIDSLVTTHTYVYRSGGGYQTSFSNGGLNGFSAGSSTKVIKKQLQNESVLNALIQISGGANFHYDQEQWKVWYAAQKKSGLINTRRD